MKGRRYVNASKVLPAELIKQIQAYTDGVYVYIPKTSRTPWGIESGIRAELTHRNEAIRKLFHAGTSIAELAELYCLSEERTRAIAFGYTVNSLDGKEEHTMPAQESFDKEEALFHKCVRKHRLPLHFVEVNYVKVRKEDAAETLTYRYYSTYRGEQLRDAARIVVKEVATQLQQPVCLRQTLRTAP